MESRNQKWRRNRNKKIRKLRFYSTNRQSICWNCLEFGHLRFQCSLPKKDICSFCHRTGVRSCDCSCTEAMNHFSVKPEANNIVTNDENSIEIPPYERNVMVPIVNQNNVTNYQRMDNMVIFVDNRHQQPEEEDRDFIEIHPEDEDLFNM